MRKDFLQELVGGWKKLTSKLVYENPWIQIFHEDVITPKNTQGIYGRVHFRGQAVGVIPLDEYDNTWIVKQSRYTLNQFTWEIPEGGAATDEDPLDCARRELKEETGLSAEHWRPILTLHTSNSVTDEKATVFLATGLTHGSQALESTEDIEVKKISLRDAIQMVERGEITDAISVAALLLIGREKGL